jgi:hypothetical protein
VGKAIVVEFDGDQEGYYALPEKVFWNDEWKSEFDEWVGKEFDELVLVKV